MSAESIFGYPPNLAKFDNRHPSVARLRRLFEYDHLPPHLQGHSAPFSTMAVWMLDTQSDSPELTEALRKLWEAKNLAIVNIARPESGGTRA